MQAAPPVSVRVAAGGGWLLLRVGLPLLAALVAAAWAFGHLGIEGGRWASAVAASGCMLVAVALLALRRARASPAASSLRWNGQHWLLADDPIAAPDVMIDLDRWLLLRSRRVTGGGLERWLAVSAADDPAAWHDLRAALYARAAAEVVAAADGTPVGI